MAGDARRFWFAAATIVSNELILVFTEVELGS